MLTRLFCLTAIVVAAGVRADDLAVVESAREIPVLADVDVVVAGGSVAAVEAALAVRAAKESVYLVAPRPYLGDDVAGKLRLSLADGERPDSPLGRSIWQNARRQLPFSYEACGTVDAKHDDKKRILLTDGTRDDVRFGSLGLTGDRGAVRATLTSEEGVGRVVVHVFRRKGDFGIGRAQVRQRVASGDWTEAVALTRTVSRSDGSEEWSADLSGRAAELEISFVPDAGLQRVLVTEIEIFARRTADGVTVPTPIQVKVALDRALVEADVDYLTSAMVSDVLVDAAGDVAGVVISDRSGRQAIRAKAVIDATDSSLVARLAAGGGAPRSGGRVKLSRVVVAGSAPSGEGLSVRRLSGTFPGRVQDLWGVPRNGRKGPFEAGLYDCTFEYELQDGSWRSLAEAEQVARDRTFATDQYDAAERLSGFPFSPVPAKPYLEVVTPDGGPVASMRRGRAAAERAATAARGRKALVGVRLRPPTVGADVQRVAGDVRERLNGLRPFDRPTATVRSDVRELPVWGVYDTVVAGGGTGGAPAAIGAARQGAKTLLVEMLYRLGGTGTEGMIGKYWYGNMCGFTAEAEAGIRKAGADVYVVGKAEWWRAEARRAGADIWMGAMVTGTVMQDNRVTGVVVSTPLGRGVVLAKNVIDATGNAELAAVSGATCDFLGKGEIALQSAGLAERRLGVSYANSDWGLADDSNAADVWLFGLRGRLGGVNAWDVSQLVETRERQRIVGDVRVTPVDVLLSRTFPDTITVTKSDFDSHGPAVDDVCFVGEANGRKFYSVNLPYRALLPRGIEGLAAIGLGASAHRDAMPLMRMQADVQNSGYAVGLASALAAKAQKTLRQVDVRALQRQLVSEGVIPPDVLNWKDSLPVTDEAWRAAVRTVGDGFKDVAVLFTDPVRAKTDVARAFAAADGLRTRVCYARILGMLGEALGGEVLADQLTGKTPFVETSPSGVPTFGKRLSDRDHVIVALGRGRSPQAVPVLLAEVARLKPSDDPGHVRAVALACESLAAPDLAPALAKALSEPGVRGWARSGSKRFEKGGGYGGNYREEIRLPLNELNLARALIRCGDQDGLARRVFESYLSDRRGVFVRHARQQLGL